MQIFAGPKKNAGAKDPVYWTGMKVAPIEDKLFFAGALARHSMAEGITKKTYKKP